MPDPDDVAGHAFSKVRKGYDVDEVRAFLVSTSSQIRDLHQRHADLSRRLTELEHRSTDQRDLDETQVTQLLGEETTRVLEAARQAATDIRAKAEQAATEATESAESAAAATREGADAYAAEVRASADAYAAELRATADAEVAELRATAAAETDAQRAEAASILSVRTEEAEAAASVIRSVADTYDAEVRSAADAAAAETRRVADEALADADAAAASTAAQADADADAVLEAARAEGRAMVDEARNYRERVIADLADRRRVARTQLEQLAATRDALSVTLADVATRIEASHRSLADTVVDPRVLGDVAADRAALADVPSTAGPTGRAPGAESEGTESEGAEPVGTGAEASTDESPVDEPEVDEPATEEPSTDQPSVDQPSVDQGTAPEPVDEGADDAEIEEPPAAPEPEAEPAADAPEEQEPGEPSSAGDPAEALFAQLKAQVSQPDGGDTEPTDVAGGAPTDAPTGGADETSGPEGHDVDPQTDLLDRRDATTDELERQLARRLKRVLSDEQNEALDRLRRVKGTPDADAVLLGQGEHLGRYHSAALEDLVAAERAGASFFGDAPTRSADVGDVAGEFAADLVRQLRGRLEAAFTDGGDEQEISDRIRSCYREWKTQRIAENAAHYVLVAFNRGLAAAAPTGLASYWIVDDGGTPCPDCDDNALAGGVPKGEPFPTGDLHPPAHPGCRCLIAPVEA